MNLRSLPSAFALAATVFVIAGNAKAEIVHASFYGERKTDGTYNFHGNQMASGPEFNMYNPKMAAHKTLPFCTQVTLLNRKNQKRLTVVVMDRGPFVRGRDFDLSWAGAKKLGFVASGVADLVVVETLLPQEKHNYGDTCDPYLSNG